jgi:WD40 repeat protein
MRHLLALALLFAASSAAADELPTQPFIKIEINRHTGAIQRIAVDAAGKWLVTGSLDKTARIWDLATGEPVRVLRTPVGGGDLGRVLAVAMTADGQTVAVGGIMPENGVYLFDRATGKLLRRLKGATSDVSELEFSADGARLAAGQLSGGVRVWNVKDGARVSDDAKYTGAINGLSFDTSGRLVTSASDGALRLYDAKGTLLKKAPAPSGKQPAGLQFSPDGSKLAVTYNDHPRVDVLSASDFKVLLQPDVSAVKTTRLLSTGWSPDGQRLVAAGSASALRLWSEAGAGTPLNIATRTLEPVTDLKTLPDGIVYGAGDPAWGQVRYNGKRVRMVEPGHPNFLALGLTGLRVSQDGLRIEFTVDLEGTQRFWFDAKTRTLTPAPAEDSTLAGPRQSSSNADFGEWRGRPNLKLNGKPISLDGEITRGLAVSGDGTFFVVAADRSLRAFTVDGRKLWTRTVPDVPLATTVSPDNRLVITAYADGTIRWQRTPDGAELLSLFVQPSTAQWVAYTPTGYYEASAGGESLFGWVKNHGADAASELLPPATQRPKFRRGEVITATLKRLDLPISEDSDRKKRDETSKKQ